jgi:hypothetical protein
LGDQARHNGLVGNVVDVLEGTVSHDSRLYRSRGEVLDDKRQVAGVHKVDASEVPSPDSEGVAPGCRAGVHWCI